jgi:hypothetical protein
VAGAVIQAPVDHATLHPCPQCGARQWLQGITYSQCAPCGYRDGPTPQEILETIASLRDYSIVTGFWYGSHGAFVVECGPQYASKEDTPCSVRVHIDPIPPKG